MYGKYNTNKEESISSKKEININLVIIYIFLLSIAIIYFSYLDKDNYLKIRMPYTILWPILIMLIGISIFRVKNKISFFLGLFITILSVGLTITSIFGYSSNIKQYKYNNTFPITDNSAIDIDLNLVDADTHIKSANKNFFEADFKSNYDSGNYTYSLENNSDNIKLEQSLFPQGLGFYDKLANITFPSEIPISFDLKLNLSSANIDLSKIKFLGATMDIKNSKVDIIVKDLDIEKDTTVDIKSFFSEINILISGDVNILLTDSSTLSQNKFIGFEKDNSNIYKLESGANKNQLIMNLKSNISKINITYE